MAIIYSYPLATPKLEDLLIGTSVYKETDLSSPRNNPTVSFSVSDLISMIGLKNGLQDLQSVTGQGATTNILSTFDGGIKIVGVLQDTNGNAGNGTQILQSTGTSVNWVNDERGTVKSVATTHAGDAFNATIGNVATVNPSVDITMNGASTDYINGEGNLTVFPNIPPGYVLPVATVAALGGVRLFNNTVNDVAPETITTTANRNYVVQLNTDNKMLVNVPWVNDNVGTLKQVLAAGNDSGGDHDINMTGDISNITLPQTSYSGSPNKGRIILGDYPNTYMSFFSTDSLTAPSNMHMQGGGKLLIDGLNFTIDMLQGSTPPSFQVRSNSMYVVGYGSGVPTMTIKNDAGNIILGRYKVYTGSNDGAMTNSTQLVMSTSIPDWTVGQAIGMTVTGAGISTITKIVSKVYGTSPLVTFTLSSPITIAANTTLTFKWTGNDTLAYNLAVDTIGNVVQTSISSSDNWYVTSGSFNATTGVLAITGNNAAVGATIDLDGRYMSSLTTTGTTGVSTFNAATGILNIPNYTFTEADTLQTVTARGASSSIATNFTGSLTVNGAGAGAYFYVSGNAQSTAPPTTYDTGMAMVWNNSGGSRENEMYYATGSGATQSDNDNSYFAFINRFNTAGTPVDDTTLKLYGNGNLELTGPTATSTIANTYWRMPTTAAPNTGYVLAKASGSINLEWVANGGSIYQTTNITVSAAQISALNGSPVTLLPAPGVSKSYYFNQAFFWFEAGSVVYDLSSFNGALYVTGGITNAITDMNSATSLMQYAALGGSSPTMNTDPATANAAVILTNTGPNPTQGNGILYISISYQIKDLGPTIQAN